VAVGELNRTVLRILTVNAGSTSFKLERYDLEPGPLAVADPPAPVYSAQTAPDAVESALLDATRDPADVVAHRFVRLPDGSPAVVRLDARASERIASAGVDAPLHDTPALRAVDIVRRLRPDVRQLAISDSAFHRTMPDAATTYALPAELTRSGLRRLGYHGLSHEYAAHRGSALAGLDVRTARVVTAHLGGGSSLCAVRGGESVDTTMGYTPLEGLPMATRSGSVDPGLLIHLLRELSVDALQEMLERRSGLLGMSGISADVRELLAARHLPAAKLALDVLGWRIRSSLGAMVAVLGGVDLITFSGGIGEHAADIRAAALDGGLGIGARLDEARNAATVEGSVAAAASSVAICVVSAREGWQLARAAARDEWAAHDSPA
jgi:acetate kinase